MQPIGLDDVLGRDRYANARDAIRRRIIDYKRARRVGVGDRVTFVFEDRATVWYQAQEMLWVERITDLDAIREELRVYGELLPGASELSATMLIEIADPAQVREALEALIGIDRCVRLEVGDQPPIDAAFEGGRQTEFKLSAVQYARFLLTPAARAALLAGDPVRLAITHPNYQHVTELSEATRVSLADAFREGAADQALARVRDGA